MSLIFRHISFVLYRTHVNISIGVGTVGGMLIGTIALLFIVPPLFMVFQYLQEKIMPARQLPQSEKELRGNE